MMDWFQAHYALVVAAVAILLYLVLGGAAAWVRVREALYALMLRAEKAARRGDFGVVTGEQLRELVIRQFVTYVLPVIRARFPLAGVFITEARVRSAFQWIYDQGMDYLDDGQFNGSAAKAGLRPGVPAVRRQ